MMRETEFLTLLASGKTKKNFIIKFDRLNDGRTHVYAEWETHDEIKTKHILRTKVQDRLLEYRAWEDEWYAREHYHDKCKRMRNFNPDPKVDGWMG